MSNQLDAQAALKNLATVASIYKGTAEEHAVLAQSVKELQKLLVTEPEKKLESEK